MKKPPEPHPPPADSLKRLADFTRRILAVPKEEILTQDRNNSEDTGEDSDANRETRRRSSQQGRAKPA